MFLLSVAALTALHFLSSVPGADAATLDAVGGGLLLSDSATSDGDIFEWIAQNAALETAWLSFIALAILFVAVSDPKR